MASELTLRFGVIKEARRRQRRRWRYVAAIVALLAAGVYVAAHVPAPEPTVHRSGTSPQLGASVAPSTVLSQPPYMGVACPEPNAIGCDRVGLAVWLRRPALSVHATIAGQPLKLDWRGDRPPGSAAPRRRRAFDGFLAPAGLVSRLGVRAVSGYSGFDPGCGCQAGPLWLGDNAPSLLVRLVIDYGRGSPVVTRLRVMLSAGWG